ncbi:hypothetical protein EYZ11_002366 [Aspergillus tanneri]|uniref:WD repeat-containing protein 44 n=1 Tax=Aspergillus tanneri TaxID=1220188 RepID=A0A4S3JR15_9EURO|nr:hypothetical protein EYZ11_002366 [Aspergillus tanneri]
MAEVRRVPRETERREVPAIVTSFAGSTAAIPTNKVDSVSPTVNKDDHSPASGKSGFLRTSQSFPIGSLPSDVADSGKFQDVGRNSRPLNGSIGVGRNSVSSPTISADASAIDPLSQHIIKRTNTQKSIPLKLLGRASYEAEVGGTEHPSPVEQSSNRGDAVLHQKPNRDKNRIIGGKKKGPSLGDEEDASEPENARIDAGTTAQPIGFIPRFPRPPKYIRVRAHNKKEKTFNRIFVAQELEGTDDETCPPDKDTPTSTTGAPTNKSAGKAVWALIFSKDGKYIAAAGQDKKVRVWAVIASPEDRREHETEGDGSREEDGPPPLKAPVFKAKPVQIYEGHTGSVLDLSWSKNNFLLSSSMDKTVRLWHVTRSECLCCFQHSDFVTSIQFHPRDDRFFLAGSLDTKLRLWSIPDKTVAFVTTAPDMVTSVAFTPDGRHSIAGCLNGMCNIYETDGLKAVAQIHVRSARGRNAKGSKITGIDTITVPSTDAHGEVKLLVTSNDSRIRLYNFRDRTLEAKFRGNENTCSQIRASFSDDGKHVICGSEDRRAYLWPTDTTEKTSAGKRAVEILETQSAMVTAAVMAPSKAKQMLGFSEDPIFDTCNPPPVTLVNEAEAAASKGKGRRNRNSGASKAAQESPAYLSRSTHPDGNIIIVADYSGKIKVLRQDCAYHKRHYDSWDTHSTISRRLLRRTNSARHSIASSIGKESHKTPSERIISWRNSVIGHHRDGSHQGGTRTRTPSPHRHTDPTRVTSSPRHGVESRPPSAYRSSMEYKISMESARPSLDARRTSSYGGIGPKHIKEPKPKDAQIPTSAAALISSGREKDNPLWLRGDQSYAFYNRIALDAMARSQQDSPDLLSPDRPMAGQRQPSTGSALSSDYGSSHGESEEGDVLRCGRCQGTNFRATNARGKQKLVCVRCSRPIS